MADSLVNIVVSIFNLTKTDAEIISVLIKHKSGMLISELSQVIHRSDRTIRYRLKKLQEKGILQKEIEILKNKRLAYRYNIKNEKTLIIKAKNHLLNKISQLNKLSLFYLISSSKI
jgi:predicted transcriptional regulator